MKSSITSNVDSKLTPSQRVQLEKDDRNDALIQGAIEQSSKDGPKVRAIDGDGPLPITYDQLADTSAYAVGDREFIRPIGYKTGPQYPGGFEWVLTDADAGAVRAGRACQMCLDYYPSTWTPACPTCLLPR